MSSQQNKAIDSQTDIRSNNPKSQLAKPLQADRYFIKLGAKNKKEITLRSLPSLNNLASSISIRDDPLDRTVMEIPDAHTQKPSKMHDFNYVYEELEFDPLKKDEYCTDKCVIY